MGYIPILYSVILMTFNFPSFLSIEIVCSLDFIVMFVKRKLREKLKLFLNFFFPCLGSILVIVYAEIYICLNIFTVPLLTVVPYLKIPNYSFVKSFIPCGFLHCELMPSYSKCTVTELLLIFASNFFKPIFFKYILLCISFEKKVFHYYFLLHLANHKKLFSDTIFIFFN